MPRKSARKEAKETPTKVEDVKDVDQESTPRRSGRAERSRRSSTAAQTAASVADSKGSKSASSPSEGRRSSARESNVESPATRVKSSRRAASRINYKESDGEEDASTPKTEDTFGSNDDFEESDSADNTDKKSSKRTKSSTKGRGAKQKGKNTSSRRGRKSKKSETVVVSDESADEDLSDSEKKDKTQSSQKSDDEEESKSTRKRPRKSAEKPGRRSSRTPAIKEIQEPINKRPSRNKQIKKYTEVDEDFSDKSEDDEVVYETEVKKESSRKRKREASGDDSSSKKQKKQRSKRASEEIEISDTEETSKKDVISSEDDIEEEESVKPVKSDAADTEEPMEVDEPKVSESTEQEKANDSKVKTTEKESEHEENVSSPSVDERITKTSDVDVKVDSKDSGIKGDSMPKNEMKDTEHSKASSQDSEEADDSSEENDHSCSDESKDELTKSVEDEAIDTTKSVNCIDSKSDNAFPAKDTTALETSFNGENIKPDVIASCPPVPSPDRVVQTNNDLPPKQNGSHEEIDSPQNFISSRRYVVNPTLSEDIRLSLKDKTFGVTSYNLQGSEAVNKDKLVQELSKLQASIICFQDVSRALYHEVLESNLDMLGFKGVGSWLKGSQHTGLATFYKTSAFRLNTSAETSLKKLVEQEIDVSSMDDSSRDSFYRNLSKCGNALFLVLSAVLGNRQLIIGNVDLPSSNVNLHTMQALCLSQELVKISEGVKKPLILCGELNMAENKVPYQLLRCGNLTDSMLDELKSKVESSPEAITFENSLKKASSRPSCKMSSCYATVLGKELSVPSTCVTSSNLVWVSPDHLRTIGVLDVTPESSDADDYPISLKADIAFSV